MNVSQLEEYLKTRGFDFNNCPEVVHIIIPRDASAKATPDLETDSGDSDDMLDQQDIASSEPWWDDSQFFPHSRNASYDGQIGHCDPPPPLGLHDEGDVDTELLAGFGLSKSARAAPPNPFDIDFVSTLDPNDYCHAQPEIYKSVPRQHVIEISMSELLKRFVSIGICIGAPGPGWNPEDVSRVVEELMEGV